MIHHRLLICTIAAQAVLAATPAAVAGDDEVLLDKIIVSGTRSETSYLNSPSKITVIDAEQIEQSGAANVIDVLRTSGGVQISDLFGDGTDASVGLRGFVETAGQNTLVLVDGRRLNNADLSTPDLNTISLKDIERIEIIKGSASVLYGDKAVGGVINIITRRPQSLRVQTEVGVGSFGQQSYFASAENTDDSGFNYRLNAKHRDSDNFRDNNAIELTDIFAKAGYEYRSGDVFFEFQDVDEDLRLPGPLGRAAIAADREQTTNPNDFSNTDSKVGRIGLVQSLSDTLVLQAEYTHRRNISSGISTFFGSPVAIDTDRKHTEFTPRLSHSRNTRYGEQIITLGGDFFKTDYLLETGLGITDNTQWQESLYVHGLFPVSQQLVVATGARRARVRNDLIDSFGAPNGIEIDDDENAWEIGVSYRPDAHWRFFAKIDETFRFAVAGRAVVSTERVSDALASTAQPDRSLL